MERLKGAVIGLRNIGKQHAEMMEKTGRMDVVALCDVDDSYRAYTAEKFPKAAFFTSAEKMLKTARPDVVALAIPHNLHAAVAIQCLEAGANVVCEKPMATKYEDCLAMIAAAQKAQRVLTVYHNRRLDPWFLAARDAIADGLLGDVYQMDIAIGGIWRGDTWRRYMDASGGAMFDWGAHLVDYALHFDTSAVTAVSGRLHRCETTHPLWNHDYGTLRIYFASGAAADVTVSGLEFSEPHRFRILGSRGTLVDEWKWTDAGKMKIYTRLSGGEAAVTELSYHKEDPQAYYTNLVGHLLDGQPLLVAPESAARVIRVLTAALESSENDGVPVQLEK